MKILYLLFSFTVGGTERLIVDICNNMVTRDNEIHLYVVNDSIDNELLNSLDSRVNVFLQRREAGSGDILYTNYKIYSYIKKNNIDIIHCNSLDTPELLFLSKLFNNNVKIFYTIHSLNYYTGMNCVRVWYRNIICTKIIAISNCVRKSIIAQGASENKVVTLYNGRNFKLMPDIKPKFDENRPVIGCLGRFVPSIKGQDLLLKAIPILKKKYPNIVCVFGGAINDDEYEISNKYICDNRISGNVIFLGNVKDISSFYAAIDIAVIPSRSEGFGLSLIEAMSVGIPTVACDMGGPAEIMAHLNAGILFECGNHNDLADKILAVLSEFDSYSKLAIDIKIMVKELFSIEKMCSDLSILYTSEMV